MKNKDTVLNETVEARWIILEWIISWKKNASQFISSTFVFHFVN